MKLIHLSTYLESLFVNLAYFRLRLERRKLNRIAKKRKTFAEVAQQTFAAQAAGTL